MGRIVRKNNIQCPVPTQVFFVNKIDLIIHFVVRFPILFFRCKVPECELGNNNRELTFNQPWLENAIPSKNGKFDKCQRYAPKNWTIDEPGKCSADMFDTSNKIKCTEFVYGSDERNLQTEVKKIMCFFIHSYSQKSSIFPL